MHGGGADLQETVSRKKPAVIWNLFERRKFNPTVSIPEDTAAVDDYEEDEGPIKREMKREEDLQLIKEDDMLWDKNQTEFKYHL